MVKEVLEFCKSAIIAIIAAFLIITFVFQNVRVDGLSMFPTLNNNDRLIVEKVSYYFRNPKRGDIVVIKYPADVREKFIKRVIAVGGDKVKIQDNKLYVNDKIVSESYINKEIMMDFDEVQIPKGKIFVLGDNRNHSKDSRDPSVGFVDLDLVVGRAAVRIYPFKKVGFLTSGIM